MNTKSNKLVLVIKNLVWLGLVLGPFLWVMLNLRLVSDHVMAWRFTPDPIVAEHQADIGFTRSADVIFEASNPQLSPASTLLAVCAEHNTSIVLGCYSDGEIYAYDVQKEELRGIVHATLAHELLHAVYARLDDDEKQRITSILFDYYDNDASDVLRQQIAAYGDASREVIGNELHSIAPIVEDSLPAELERHYAKYFDDITVIRRYFDGYWSQFQRLNQEVGSFDVRIGVVGNDLDSSQSRLAQYKRDIDNYAGQADRLESAIDAADSADVNDLINQYNAVANNYQRSVREHNQVVEQHNSLIEKYNGLLEKRAEAADDLAGLYEAIDPRDSAPSVETQTQ